MDKPRKKRQRAKLYEQQQGLCYWCRQPMVVPVHGRHKPRLPNEVTVDHLDSRLSPERGLHAGSLRHVLACHACNGRRAADEEAALMREEIWERSGRSPVGGSAHGGFTRHLIGNRRASNGFPLGLSARIAPEVLSVLFNDLRAA